MSIKIPDLSHYICSNYNVYGYQNQKTLHLVIVGLAVGSNYFSNLCLRLKMSNFGPFNPTLDLCAPSERLKN